MEYRGIPSYIDARPEVFAPSNHHLEQNIIKEYNDSTDGELYYKDVFRKYHFTHILVTKADGVIYYMLPHDPEYRMIYEGTSKEWGESCRIFVPVEQNDSPERGGEPR